MTDNDYQDMVLAHDKHIDTLANSIESLATNVGATNDKLNDVIDVITQQNVLVERMNNMDKNVSESFIRAWGRLEKLENTVERNGCSIAKGLDKEKEVFTEKLNGLDKRINKVVTTSEENSTEIKTFISSKTVKWVIGMFVFYAVTFGSYVVSSIHNNDNTINSYINASAVINKNTEKRIDSIVELLKRKGSITLFSAKR